MRKPAPPNLDPYVLVRERPLNDTESNDVRRVFGVVQSAVRKALLVSVLSWAATVGFFLYLRATKDFSAVVFGGWFTAALVASFALMWLCTASLHFWKVRRMRSLNFAWDYGLPTGFKPAECGDEEHPWQEVVPEKPAVTIYPVPGVIESD